MAYFPSVSIVSPTYNCNLELFKRSLDSIKNQDFPRNLVEHIVIDGGSKNGTLALAESYGCKIIERPDLICDTQQRISLGAKASKNDIILFLETDNIAVGRDWLQKATFPFIETKEIFCTYSMYNAFFADMPLLTKYFALIGVNDALLYYLGKTEKIPLDENIYNKGQVIKEYPTYYLVKILYKELPPMGDNGFFIRKKILEKVNKDPKKFIHVDIFANLVKEGYNSFGVIKNSIVHYAGSNILEQYRKRIAIKRNFYDDKRSKRTYLTFNPHSKRDMVNLIKFIFFSLTFILPFLRSVKGYLKVRELAWFLHPIVCFIALFMYTKSELDYLLQKCKWFTKFTKEVKQITSYE